MTTKVITLTQHGVDKPISIMKDKIKTFRHVDFDRGDNVRIITLVDQQDIWVTESVEEIENLLNS